MLDELSRLMDGGSIQLLTGDGKSAARAVRSGGRSRHRRRTRVQRIAEEDAALAQGNALLARILAADGSEVFPVMSATRKRRSRQAQHYQVFRGGPVRLSSFRLGCRRRAAMSISTQRKTRS